MSRLRIGIIGRTEMLLEAARRVMEAGHEIGLVATCRPSGHELAGEDDFERLARLGGAPFLRHRELTGAEGLSAIRTAGCDLALSMNWLTLIPPSVRSLFRLGVFNAHPGDLPRYKGNACPSWAIINGEDRIGLTIHQMDDGLDSGPVAAKRYFAVRPDSAIADVYDWLREAVPEAFLSVTAAAAHGDLRLEPQPAAPDASLRCFPRRPEDGRIDWTAPVATVDRLIRASGRPFDGAFAFLDGGRKVTIWSARPLLSGEPFLAIAGQVAYAVDGDPVIAGSGGFLRLTDIRMDGCADAADAKKQILSSLRNRLT